MRLCNPYRIAGITPEVLRQASQERKAAADWRAAAAAATAANNGEAGANANPDKDASSASSAEDNNEKAEKIILAIEKFSVFVFLFSFLMFNVYYWVDLFSANSS